MILPAGYGNCRFLFQVSGSPKTMGWSLGYKPPPDQDVSEQAGSMYDAFSTEGLTGDKPYIPGLMMVGWTWLGVSCTYQGESGDPLIGEYINPVAGGASGGALPMNCAILVQKLSALGGRKNKGRGYVPPVYPGESEVSNTGSITPTTVGSLNEYYNNAIAALTSYSYEPVILHSTPGLPAVVLTFNVESEIATQRRRLR